MFIFASSAECSDLSPETISFGKKLRNARRSRGLTQRQLAEMLGIAQTNVDGNSIGGNVGPDEFGAGVDSCVGNILNGDDFFRLLRLKIAHNFGAGG